MREVEAEAEEPLAAGDRARAWWQKPMLDWKVWIGLGVTAVAIGVTLRGVDLREVGRALGTDPVKQSDGARIVVVDVDGLVMGLAVDAAIEVLAVSGGVAANRLLRRRLEGWAQEHQVDLRLVPLRYAGDNAAMIAHAALLRKGWGREDDPLSTDAASRIPL